MTMMMRVREKRNGIFSSVRAFLLFVLFLSQEPNQPTAIMLAGWRD
jgi:hypothetical protein